MPSPYLTDTASSLPDDVALLLLDLPLEEDVKDVADQRGYCGHRLHGLLLCLGLPGRFTHSASSRRKKVQNIIIEKWKLVVIIVK